MSRPKIAWVRWQILTRLGDEWRNVSEVCQLLGIGHGGTSWYKTALALERLVSDGKIELQRANTRVRRYRRKA